MPLDYVSWIAMALRYMDTRECWYMPNWLYYLLQTKNFLLFWSHTWKYGIQPRERLTKIKEKWSSIQFDVFVLSLIFFVPMTQTISVINISDACNFLHASNYWHMWGSQKLLHGLVSRELTAYLSIFNLFWLIALWSYFQKHVNQIILNCITL